jgi:hypothetical protein
VYARQQALGRGPFVDEGSDESVALAVFERARQRRERRAFVARLVERDRKQHGCLRREPVEPACGQHRVHGRHALRRLARARIGEQQPGLRGLRHLPRLDVARRFVRRHGRHQRRQRPPHAMGLRRLAGGQMQPDTGRHARDAQPQPLPAARDAIGFVEHVVRARIVSRLELQQRGRLHEPQQRPERARLHRDVEAVGLRVAHLRPVVPFVVDRRQIAGRQRRRRR